MTTYSVRIYDRDKCLHQFDGATVQITGNYALLSGFTKGGREKRMHVPLDRYILKLIVRESEEK